MLGVSIDIGKSIVIKRVNRYYFFGDILLKYIRNVKIWLFFDLEIFFL